MRIRALLRPSGRVLPICAALLLSGCMTTPEIAPPQYLHVQKTKVSRGVDPSRPLKVAIQAKGIQGILSLQDPDSILEVGAESAVLDLTHYSASQDHPTDSTRDLESTFVIDYDSPEVQEWSARLVEETASPSPSVEQIIESVNSGIEGTYARGFDFASTVARTRLGDCTEYAVLFAALSRRFGYPTRVTFGTIVIPNEAGEFQAFGHAWNEVWTPEGWIKVDSTLIPDIPTAAYIPTGYLTNEGPGYSRSLLGAILEGVESVHIMGNVSGR